MVKCCSWSKQISDTNAAATEATAAAAVSAVCIYYVLIRVLEDKGAFHAPYEDIVKYIQQKQQQQLQQQLQQQQHLCLNKKVYLASKKVYFLDLVPQFT